MNPRVPGTPSPFTPPHRPPPISHHHMPYLTLPSPAPLPSQHELLRCKTVLQDYFKATFPKAAEAAEMHRQASLAAGRESPDSIMTMSHDVAPDHAKQTAMPIDSAPEFCFSPVR